MDRIHKLRRSERPPRIVASLDLDCFYASVAIRARPHLKTEPVGIVQRQLVVTSNYVARGLGVKKMTWVKEAQRVCPQIHFVDGSDLTPFRAASVEVLSTIRNWLSHRLSVLDAGKSLLIPCEKLGLDEVFIDLTDLVALEIKSRKHDWVFDGHTEGSSSDEVLVRSLMVASQVVRKIRMEVTEKTKLTMCAGISSNKLLAKLAGNIHKPNDQTVLFKDSAASYICELSPRSLMGIGNAMWGKLTVWAENAKVSIDTVKLLLAYFEDGDHVRELADILGSDTQATHVLRLCRGEDDSVVKNSGPPKSTSCEESFLSCTTMEDVTRRLENLSSTLLRRLGEDFAEWGFREPKTLVVKVRLKGQGYRFLSRSAPLLHTITRSVCNGEEQAVSKAKLALMTSALNLLKSHGDISASESFNLSLLGIAVTNFTSNDVNPNSSIGRFLRPIKSAPLENCTEQSGKDASDAVEVTEDAKPNAVIETKSPREKPRCPICKCALPLSSFFQNAHIDSCISSRSSSAPSKLIEKNGDVGGSVTATPINNQENEAESNDADIATDRPLCPICQRSLPLGAFFQNAHIDSCISSDRPNEKPEPGPRKKLKRGSRLIESFFKKKE